MTKSEMLRRLVLGQMMSCEGWGPDEFFYMNRNGQIKMEDGTLYEPDQDNGYVPYISPTNVLENSVSHLGEAIFPRSNFTQYQREIVKKLYELGISKKSLIELSGMKDRSLRRVIYDK